jgi:hypothetical protein
MKVLFFSGNPRLGSLNFHEQAIDRMNYQSITPLTESIPTLPIDPLFCLSLSLHLD